MILGSSIGRAVVSKTKGWGFKSLPGSQNAGRQDKGRPAAFQAEDRGVRLSLPAPIYLGFA